MDDELASKSCIPCKGGVPPLAGDDIEAFIAQLDDAWHAVDEHHLARELAFPNFATALAFVNRVGELAEAEGHHPDIALSWGKVGLVIYTHSIDGLTESDFILAAKIDRLYASR